MKRTIVIGLVLVILLQFVQNYGNQFFSGIADRWSNAVEVVQRGSGRRPPSTDQTNGSGSEGNEGEGSESSPSQG